MKLVAPLDVIGCSCEQAVHLAVVREFAHLPRQVRFVPASDEMLLECLSHWLGGPRGSSDACRLAKSASIAWVDCDTARFKSRRRLTFSMTIVPIASSFLSNLAASESCLLSQSTCSR